MQSRDIIDIVLKKHSFESLRNSFKNYSLEPILEKLYEVMSTRGSSLPL